MKKCWFLLLVCGCTFCVHGQKLNVAKLDSLFDLMAAENLGMGSIAVARHGVIEYQRATGYSFTGKEKTVPATISTVYRIGSETKMFTAVLVFQFIEEGKLSAEQPLSFFYPTIPNATRISVQQLLGHRSGLHNYTEGTNFPDWMDQPVSRDSMLALIVAKGSDAEPGIRAGYSNTNYLLLSYIIEKISDSSYSDLVQERIVKRAGLKDTRFASRIDEEPNGSASYRFLENKWVRQKETNPGIHAGAGSLVSTPSDITRFLEALFTYRLLDKKGVEAMTSITDGYGSGLFPMDHGNHQGFGHNGRIEEFYSTATYFPRSGLAFSYITNGIIYPRADLVDLMLKACFDEPASLPYHGFNLLPSRELEQLTGTYKSDNMGLEVVCTIRKNKLVLTIRGKEFQLTQIGDHYFSDKPAGYFFEFIPASGFLLVKELDNVYQLEKAPDSSTPSLR
ncbi:MAG: class A beta-lactamase-related serine hydrolase [Chitinophagaceae bacterium]|nr:MAG: class A beta-lactamase-related serine hydrolase [Chitinophagaceae bacterium]